MKYYEKVGNKWVHCFDWDYINYPVNSEYTYLTIKMQDKITKHYRRTISGVYAEIIYLKGGLKYVFFEN